VAVEDEGSNVSYNKIFPTWAKRFYLYTKITS